jgi:hypothetical protein
MAKSDKRTNFVATTREIVKEPLSRSVTEKVGSKLRQGQFRSLASMILLQLRGSEIPNNLKSWHVLIEEESDNLPLWDVHRSKRRC